MQIMYLQLVNNYIFYKITGKTKMKILILYHYIHEYPIRATIRDHLYSFKKYSKAKCYYYNVGASFRAKTYLLKIKFDLIIFHTTFLSCRWGGSEYFKKVTKKINKIQNNKIIKIALPQDEFIYCNDLCEFIRDFKINHVFSVAPESEWKKIYDSIDFSKVTFHQVLTGYLNNTTIKKISNLSQKISNRPFDIGYRAYKAPQWLGRHGFLKTKIADVFKQESPKYNLNVDISTNPKDTILGDKWYKFMLKCKYFIGVEGGSTILDRDGKIKDNTNKYIKEHPTASFKEIEEACFPEIDGYLKLIAISPRQIEACATRTCQILIEGRYNNILKPNIHYIELKKDFSNIKEVLKLIKDDKVRKKITENAYNDIVKSGIVTYKNFVRNVLEKSRLSYKSIDNKITLLEKFNYYRSIFAEFIDRRKVQIIYNPLMSVYIIIRYKILRKFIKNLKFPFSIIKILKKMLNK